MQIEITGDNTTRRYRIVDITQDQYDLLIKALSPTAVRTPVGNRKGTWHNNTATINVTVAERSTGEDVDELIKKSTGAAI